MTSKNDTRNYYKGLPIVHIPTVSPNIVDDIYKKKQHFTAK